MQDSKKKFKNGRQLEKYLTHAAKLYKRAVPTAKNKFFARGLPSML